MSREPASPHGGPSVPPPPAPVGGLAVEADLGDAVLGRAYRSRANGRGARVLVLAREDYAWLLKTRYRDLRVNVGAPGVRPLGDAVPAGTKSWVTSELASATLAEDTVESDQAFEAVKKACRTVAAAHERGRIHGLITAQDIEATGEVSGFGLAEVARRLAGDLYEAHVQRIAEDVAPEVRRADKTPPTPATDVYGLGRALARGMGDEMSQEVAAIVAKATAPQPARRHADAGALLAALEAVEVPVKPRIGTERLRSEAAPPPKRARRGTVRLEQPETFTFDDDSAEPAKEPAAAPPPPPPPPAVAPAAAHDAVADVLKHLESLEKAESESREVGSITGHLQVPKGVVSDAEIDSGDILGDDFKSLEDARASRKRDTKPTKKKPPRMRQSDAELKALGDLNALPPIDDLLSKPRGSAPRSPVNYDPLASGSGPVMAPFDAGAVKPAFDDPNASGPYPDPFADPLAAPPPALEPPSRPGKRPSKQSASTKTRATGWASDDQHQILPGNNDPRLAGAFGAFPPAPPSAPGLGDPFADPFASPAPGGFGDPFAPAGGGDPFAPPAGDPFAPAAGGDPFAPVGGGDPFAAPPALGGGGPDPFAAGGDPFAPVGGGDPFAPAGGDPFAAPPTFGGGPDPFAAPPAFGAPDHFGAPAGGDPFAPAGLGQPDPFAAPPAFGAPPGGDPFAAPGQDPFAAPGGFAPGGDPFAAPGFGGAPDPFGAPPGGDPFAAPGGFGGGDPFAAPGGDPFAPGGDPFGAAPGGDPFGAPGGFGGDPFGAPGNQAPFDPYGATTGPTPAFGQAAQDPSFDPFGAAPDPFAPEKDDPFGSAKDAARAQQQAHGELLPPISDERDKFASSKDPDPFAADEPELEVAPPPPPPAGVKKTRVMPGAGGGTCGLLLVGIVGKKKEKAADVVAKLRGISKAEALELLSKNMVTVLSGVSRAEAEKAQALFQQVDVQAKITEKKG